MNIINILLTHYLFDTICGFNLSLRYLPINNQFSLTMINLMLKQNRNKSCQLSLNRDIFLICPNSLYRFWSFYQTFDPRNTRTLFPLLYLFNRVFLNLWVAEHLIITNFCFITFPFVVDQLTFLKNNKHVHIHSYLTCW